MRILLVCGSFPPMKCGVGDYTEKLATALAVSPEHSVGVLTRSTGTAPPENRGYTLLPGIRRWSVMELRAAVSAITAFRPDVVHFQFPARGYGRLQWILPGILRLRGFNVFLTLHENFEVRDARSLLTATLFFPNLLAASAVSVTIPDYAECVPGIYRRILRGKPVHHIPIASNIQTVCLSGVERQEVRRKYGVVQGGDAMIAYFGFVSPPKGVEAIFEIANPALHRIVLACELSESDTYHRSIAERIVNPPWKGRVEVSGFLEGEEVGRLLAASDAVIIPFRQGIRAGHGSLEAAVAQGTFTLTTSRDRKGYDPKENIYFAHPGDTQEMRKALETYLATRVSRSRDHTREKWRHIAEAHIGLYSAAQQGKDRRV
ncbi:MAG TPA: hypothetical protein DCP41_03860 [Deltaproteobacteria bacterium]|nr:hypothetical protein [Deltaproteobacteria bacterium]